MLLSILEDAHPERSSGILAQYAYCVLLAGQWLGNSQPPAHSGPNIDGTNLGDPFGSQPFAQEPVDHRSLQTAWDAHIAALAARQVQQDHVQQTETWKHQSTIPWSSPQVLPAQSIIVAGG